jgi:small subunit ribosomal protein S1
VPLSQLVGPARELYVPGGEPPKEGFIGMEVEFKIIELNRRRNRAIFSERAALQAWKQIQKMRLVQELTEGEIRKGRVAGISNFGAFVDLGGADGLIHISELSWEPVKSPDEIVTVGEEIDVFVLRVDRENLKIALSLRRLQPEPWDEIETKFSVGQTVTGTVTKLANFGAFARIDRGIEGLIHISELAHQVIKHPRDVVSEGDELELKIIRIEPERRRLGLSLKQTLDGSEEVLVAAEPEEESSGDIGDFGDIFEDQN